MIGALLVIAGLGLPSTSGAFQASVTNSSNTAGASNRFSCTSAYTGASLKSNAYLEYSLAGTGASETDLGSSGDTGAYVGNHSTTSATTSDACPLDTGAGAANFWTLNGTSDWMSTATQVGTPAAFTLVVWFRSPALADTSKARYLLGFASEQTSTAGGQRDRQLYIDINGYLQFGVYNGGAQMANSTGNTYDNNTPVTSGGVKVTDGRWHQAVGVGTAGSGIALWLDGVKIATSAKSSVDSHSGYWRIGAASLSGWPNTPSNADTAGNYFTGDLRFAAVYKLALSDSQIAALYADGKPGT